jgi:Zn-dependent peptidase ImmA (M78 family)
MPAPFRDYWVPYKSEVPIANIALEWRREGGIFNNNNFDICDFVENVLAKRFTRKGTLKIEFFESSPNDDLAFVTYKPLILHVDPEVWKDAKMGDPQARHIIAHEIGHIILHDHYAKAFSNDPSQNIKSGQNENSAEWQANRFADHLLAPDHLVKAFSDCDSLASPHYAAH